MSFRRLTAVFLAAFLALSAAGARAEESGTPSGGEALQFRKTDAPPSMKFEELYTSTLPINWSSFYGVTQRGPHVLIMNGGLVSRNDPALWGGDMPMGLYAASFTYRYMGLFGGIVRPVARFTAGAAQTWHPVGGVNSRGFDPALSEFAVSEAGVEIVYKGVGVGMTAGYVWTADPFEREKDILGPPLPSRSGNRDFNFDNLWKNVYLILE